MGEQKTFLLFGATGQTGQHLTSLALNEGHKVKALARDPAKFSVTHPDLEVREGTISDVPDLETLVTGTDFVICMLGDAAIQKQRNVNTDFIRQLVPAMRRQGVNRFLYQAGGLSRAPGRRLSIIPWLIRTTIAREFDGQHRDNEAVMSYLAEEATDIEWMVHRAAIGSNGVSKGVLQRSHSRISVATFIDCAEYNFRTVMDPSAIHTCDFSLYQKA